MEVLSISSEMVPFSKVGGLGDVAGSLPKALAARGIKVRAVTPLHSSEPPAGAHRLPHQGTVNIGGHTTTVTWYKYPLADRCDVYLMDLEGYFRTNQVYAGDEFDRQRYAAFCMAMLQLPAVEGFVPDVVHAHDWHVGLAPWLVRHHPLPEFMRTASLFTIHNLQYQGHFSVDWFQRMVAPRFPEALPLQAQGVFPSMMSLGILTATGVSTVSPSYAREILLPEQGYGLQGLLARRHDQVAGIVNGIDYELWDPSTDAYLPYHFSTADLTPRAVVRTTLQRRFNLPQRSDIPVFGVVTRLADQKGVDILLPALEEMLSAGTFQVVFVANGHQPYEDWVRSLASRFPDRVGFTLAFREDLARLVYGGSDMLLMPSRFEPCGLGQMIAMRYGSIPVARRTGGLGDTIMDSSDDLSHGTGFLFDGYDAGSLAVTIERAIKGWHNHDAWGALQRRAMKQDFSWDRSADQYEALYHRLIATKRHAHGV